MYTLRPYQAEAKDAILHEWDIGNRRTLLILPTGAGKTVVFSSVTENQVNRGHKVLIMAHRGELLEQAADKLKRMTGIDSALEKADSSSLGSFFPVTVGSVQSLSQPRRLDRFPTDYYQDIIVDEAHHCLSDSYKRVLEHFHDANVLGVTATPDRGDKKDLSEFFDSQAYEYSMADAVKDGYLCPIKAQMIPLKLDISDVGISNGDFSAGDIGHSLEPYLERIANEMTHYCKGRKTVVFLPLISISQEFCQMLQKAGFRAAEVNGTSEDRDKVLADFEAGKYEILCNSMLLTEGWDCPSVDCVVVLRPTKVRALYQQMVGRGMRLADGKEDLLLLDFLWMTERHDLCKPSSLVSRTADIAERIDQRMLRETDGFSLTEAVEKAESDAAAERRQSLAKQLAAQSDRQSMLINPLEYMFRLDVDLTDYEPIYKWEREPATERQLNVLKERNIATDGMTKGLASKMIDRIFQMPSDKQVYFLEKRGFVDVIKWSRNAASEMIGRIKSLGLPYDFNPATYRPF